MQFVLMYCNRLAISWGEGTCKFSKNSGGIYGHMYVAWYCKDDQSFLSPCNSVLGHIVDIAVFALSISSPHGSWSKFMACSHG